MFKKVPLRVLIDALIVLYDSGSNYVDIMGVAGEEQDEIGLAIKEEYMAPEEDLEYEEEDGDNGTEEGDDMLDEETINKLI